MCHYGVGIWPEPRIFDGCGLETTHMDSMALKAGVRGTAPCWGSSIGVLWSPGEGRDPLRHTWGDPAAHTHRKHAFEPLVLIIWMFPHDESERRSHAGRCVGREVAARIPADMLAAIRGCTIGLGSMKTAKKCYYICVSTYSMPS